MYSCDSCPDMKHQPLSCGRSVGGDSKYPETPSSPRPRTIPGGEGLADFAVSGFLLEFPAGVFGEDGPPEADGGFVVEELGDLPAAGEAIEDQLSGVATDAEAPGFEGDEKLGHAKIDLVTAIA